MPLGPRIVQLLAADEWPDLGALRLAMLGCQNTQKTLDIPDQGNSQFEFPVLWMIRDY
jgi:hypothetical protein